MNRLFAALIGAVLFAWANPAEAQSSCQGGASRTMPAGEQLLCSKSYFWTGPCTSSDFVMTSTFNGLPSWKITPWETQDINIRGVELNLIVGSADVWWAMIGNSAVPDAMGFLANNERHLRTWFPPGMGMPFPSIATAQASDYIDIHGGCNSGAGNALGFVTFYYTVP